MTELPEKLKIFIYRPKPARQTIWTEWLFKTEPLELEYLYTVLKDYADITLIDGQVKNYNLLKLIPRQHPDVILITSLITNMSTVLKMAKQIKNLDDPPLIFVGGPHAEVVPEHFFTPHIDGVFFNNQLEAIQKVIKCILQGKSFFDVLGTAFLVEGKFIVNKPEKVDYENYPIPERPLLKKFKGEYNILYFRDCATLKTSFGCPEKCTFCFCRKMNLMKYSLRPLDLVIKEIETIQNENIFIVDDNFLLSPKRLKEFCKEINKRNIHKKFIVYSTARFITQHPELMEELKNSGLSAVIVGIEFITNDALMAVNKGSLAAENEESIEICRKLDIEYIGLFMLSPEWKASKFKDVADFVKKRKIYFATFATFTKLPGTDLWTDKDEKTIDTDKWWRYDLLRLHQTPRYMSKMKYYLLLNNLYLKLVLKPDTFFYLKKRAGLWGTIRIIYFGVNSVFNFLFKLLIWP